LEEYMSDTIEAAPPPRLDERMGRKSALARLFARPEAAASSTCRPASR
jgi:hypothetical protein